MTPHGVLGVGDSLSLVRFYQDVGTGTGDVSVFYLRDVALSAKRQGFIPGVDFVYIEWSGQTHDPNCWGCRLPTVLRFLIGKSGATASNPTPAGSVWR